MASYVFRAMDLTGAKATGEGKHAGGECGLCAAGAPHGINQPQRLPSGAVSLWICR